MQECAAGAVRAIRPAFARAGALPEKQEAGPSVVLLWFQSVVRCKCSRPAVPVLFAVRERVSSASLAWPRAASSGLAVRPVPSTPALALRPTVLWSRETQSPPRHFLGLLSSPFACFCCLCPWCRICEAVVQTIEIRATRVNC